MKRIIITEDQAKRLNLINEDVNPLTVLERISNVRTPEMDSLYVKLSKITIEALIKNSLDVPNLQRYIDHKIETELDNAYSNAYDYSSSSSDDLTERIDLAYYPLKRKINAIQLILGGLEKFQSSMSDGKVSKTFK